MSFVHRAALAVCLMFVAGPALAQPATDSSTPLSVPAPTAVAPAIGSALTITLGTAGGDFERRSIAYNCKGDVPTLTVDYLNAAPNYLALIPIDGSTLVFNTVLSASGARYAAGKYVWWTKGNDSSLYDETQGENAAPILTCTAANDTP